MPMRDVAGGIRIATTSTLRPVFNLRKPSASRTDHVTTRRTTMAAASQRSTIVGVFEDRQRADQAVGELSRAGFREDQIGVAMRHTEGESGRRPRRTLTTRCRDGGGRRGIDRPGPGGPGGPGRPGRGHSRRRPGHRGRHAGRHPLQCGGRGRHRGPGRGPHRLRHPRARGEVLPRANSRRAAPS